eukprot:6183966-Pleurochrysis_carterae.AAC.2
MQGEDLDLKAEGMNYLCSRSDCHSGDRIHRPEHALHSTLEWICACGWRNFGSSKVEKRSDIFRPEMPDSASEGLGETCGAALSSRAVIEVD